MTVNTMGHITLPSIKLDRDFRRASKSSVVRRRSSHTINSKTNPKALAQKLAGRRRSSRLIDLNTLKAQLNIDFGGIVATGDTTTKGKQNQSSVIESSTQYDRINSNASSRQRSAPCRRPTAMSMSELCEYHRTRTSSTTAATEQAKWDSALTEARERYTVTRDINTASENMRRLAKEHSQRGMNKLGSESIRSPADVIRVRNAHTAARRRILRSPKHDVDKDGWHTRSSSGSDMLEFPAM